MSLWLVRAGSHGEFEDKFLKDGRIYLTWHGFDRDLSKFEDRESLRAVLAETYPESGAGKRKNHANQIWAFGKRISPGDWVVLPSKSKPAVHFGEVKSGYEFQPNAPDPYYHSHKVDWLAQDIPRANFDQDLLYSFGAFLTICKISRNDAERRIREMAEAGWKSQTTRPQLAADDEDGVEETAEVDIEQVARDQLARHIGQRFKSDKLEVLVKAVLDAKGYTTYKSPVGADKGVDLLVGSGALGFDSPRICVQVKSSDSPVERAVLDQLIGTMQNFNADHGLLVSWGGFKSSIDEAAQFFRVRLWDSDDVIDELLANYDALDKRIRAELPLKQIWVLSQSEDE